MKPRILGFKAAALLMFYLFALAGLSAVQDDPQAVSTIISTMGIVTGAALAVRGYQETRQKGPQGPKGDNYD